MTPAIRAIAIGTSLLLVAGCTIDFDEAVPCNSTEQCPDNRVCDLEIRRCVSAGAVVDGGPTDTGERDVSDDTTADTDLDAADVTDTAGDAPGDVLDDTPGPDTIGGDTGTPDTIGGDTGTTDATEPDADDTGSGDTGTGEDTGEPCVPTAEVCDGLDNDCDGTPDNGLDCGPCGPNAVQLTGDGASFCIDLYEASRRDATAESAGTDSSAAVSVPGVMPWSNVPYAVAESACAAVGKRLCSAAEWQIACEGDSAFLYPYDRRLYDGEACNGLNVPPRDAPVATGQFEACASPDGTFDQSGNLAEWASDRRTHGGAFDDVSTNLKCTSVDGNVNVDVSAPSVGFRCCGDPI